MIRCLTIDRLIVNRFTGNTGPVPRPPDRQDAVDHHVDRWASYWADKPEFRPEVEGAITRMQSIVREVRRQNAAHFTDPSFTYEDFNTLHELMVQPFPTEATPAQLADANHVTRAAMTSRLDRLVEAGLVSRSSDPLDRRRVIVRPTPAGREAWDTHVHAGMVLEAAVLDALSPAELAAAQHATAQGAPGPRPLALLAQIGELGLYRQLSGPPHRPVDVAIDVLDHRARARVRAEPVQG